MIFETVEAWIDRQPWPDEAKDEARAIHNGRLELDLNPMTRTTWRQWADSKGLELAPQQR